jgi:lysophospholipase L1-like esterase
VFAGLAMLLSTAAAGGGLLALDLYLHYRHGVNLWGYRGPVLGPKAPGERRVAVVGGSTAWGYGVTRADAFPAILERRLDEVRHRQGAGPVRVANLAYNNEGAYSFRFTLEDYAYLHYDVALLYTGYNDLGWSARDGPGNRQVIRRASPVFRLTGYWPLIPVIVPRVLGWSWDREAGDRTFAIEGRRRRGRRADPGAGGPAAAGDLDGEGWAYYCWSVRTAVEYALGRGARVMVVTQPFISPPHVAQQRALGTMLRTAFGGDRRVRHVDLGGALDLRDAVLTFDGMHLTPAGNARIAEALVGPTLELLE